MTQQKPPFFITGTDTGVGKTVVASLLLRALRDRGVLPRVMKPVETGCEPTPTGELLPEDAVKLKEAAGTPLPLEEIVFARYRSPVAPSVAAEAEQRPLDYSAIVSRIRTAAEQEPIVIYEGAGGLFVPLTTEKTFLDLARDTGAVTIVVVGSKLGAINHAALTFHALRAESLPCLGYVMNDLFRNEAERPAAPGLASAIGTNRRAFRQAAACFGLDELAVLLQLTDFGFAQGALAPLADRLIAECGL